jgi:glycosyltransferase involved in cell wall biosynthesis
VVIPTFNRRTQVAAAVDSVLKQRGAAPEVIVVDDGSTDDTAAALDGAFGAAVRILRSENRGVAAARNLGVSAARGDWIAFLDSDDLWMPEKLRRQMDFATQHAGVEICQTGEIWIRNGVRVNSCLHHRKPHGDIFEASLQRCLVSPSAVLMRRSLFERHSGFDIGLPACEDYDLWLRIAAEEPIALLDEPLVIKHGGHADQLSRRYWGMDRFRVASMAGLLAREILNPQQRAATVSTLQKKCTVLAHGAQRRRRLDEAERYRSLAIWAFGLDRKLRADLLFHREGHETAEGQHFQRSKE